MKNNEITKDAFGKEFELSKDAFELVQSDAKIHDVKFETKPTTFAKDAFKRFTRNKSSVVGAIIIAFILLITIIVPVVSPHNVSVDYASPKESLLIPKLFEGGTGFWDGTKKETNIPYNSITGLPIGNFEERAIIGGKEGVEVYVNSEGDTVCKFRYDYYEHKLGTQVINVEKIKVNKYIENGWMTLDYSTGEYEILDKEKCPINKVYSIDGNNVKAEVEYYKVLGYSKMPKYLFGTTEAGKDAFTLTFKGLGVSLLFSIFISFICFIFGLVWGAVSGYFGGNVDLFMERFCDILGGVPTIVIVTLLRLHFGASFGIFVLALCLTGWLSTSARTRTQFYRFKGREYVLASRTLGSSDTRLIFKHILPNSLGTIVTSSVLMIPGVMFTEATLSYLHLGIEGITTFGTILSQHQQFLETYPALIVLPAIIISLLMISFNLFGNGLRDALNPSLKGSE